MIPDGIVINLTVPKEMICPFCGWHGSTAVLLVSDETTNAGGKILECFECQMPLFGEAKDGNYIFSERHNIIILGDAQS